MSDQREDIWGSLFEQINEVVTDSIETNLEAQTALIESWAETVEQSVPDEEVFAEGIEGYTQAYEIWMDATETLFEQTTDAAQGEDISPEEFREFWLRSANEAFSEVMAADELNRSHDSATDEDQTDSEESRQDIAEIDGIGPTYAQRLREHGIETIDDLAEADAEKIATIAETTESRIEDWLDQV